MTPQIRAIILAIVVLIHGLAAAPLPSKMHKRDQNDEAVQKELSRWVDALSGIGISVSEKGLWNFSYQAGNIATKSRNAILKPVRPFFKLTGTGQGWGLFTHPDRRPDHLEVWGKAENAKEWKLLYRSLDEDHRFMADKLSYRRLRGLWDGNANRPKRYFKKNRKKQPYLYFTQWVACEAFSKHPELHKVKVQYERSFTTTPKEKPNPHTEVNHREVIERESCQ